MGIYDAEKGSWFVGKINYMVFAVAADISDFSLIQRYFPVIAPMYAFALQPNDDFMISKMAVRQLLPLRIHRCDRNDGLKLGLIRFKLQPMLFSPVKDEAI